MSASVHTTIWPRASWVPIRRTVPEPPLRRNATIFSRGNRGAASRSRASVPSLDASSKPPGGARSATSALDALGPGQFDLVCAFEVFEHIDDDAAAVRQWAARCGARPVCGRAHRGVRPPPPASQRGAGRGGRYGTAPFRLLQRGFPGTGAGLVVLARLAG